MNDIINQITYSFNHSGISSIAIIAVLCMSLLFAIFEYFVYRFVSHRAFYNKAFNICIALLPSFISTIILSLQSNTVVILGTIGALAILRFRTAVKDPVDMLYLLWSVHIGITCGCQLYLMTLMTSALVTICLFLMNYISIGKKPYVLVIRSNSIEEEKICEAVTKHTSAYKIKSRNYTGNGTDYVFELSVKEPAELADSLKEIQIEKFSIIEYDSEDIL